MKFDNYGTSLGRRERLHIALPRELPSDDNHLSRFASWKASLAVCLAPFLGSVRPLGPTPLEAGAWRQCGVLRSPHRRDGVLNALSAPPVEVSNRFVIQVSINCLVQSIARTIARFDACIDAKNTFLFQYTRFPSLPSISNIDISFCVGLALYRT